MKKILVIRHGQTLWNVQKRLQGHTDIPLNEVGRRQSLALKNVLAPFNIEAFFTSDLIRAIDTASLARTCENIPIYKNSGLREASLGEAEGLFFDELHLRFPDAYERWLSTGNANENFSFPKGESISTHRNRIKTAIEEILQTTDHSCIAIVTHGGSMRRIFELCSNFNDPKIRTLNTSVYELEYCKSSKNLSYIKNVYTP